MQEDHSSGKGHYHTITCILLHFSLPLPPLPSSPSSSPSLPLPPSLSFPSLPPSIPILPKEGDHLKKHKGTPFYSKWRKVGIIWGVGFAKHMVLNLSLIRLVWGPDWWFFNHHSGPQTGYHTNDYHHYHMYIGAFRACVAWGRQHREVIWLKTVWTCAPGVGPWSCVLQGGFEVDHILHDDNVIVFLPSFPFTHPTMVCSDQIYPFSQAGFLK